MAKDVILLRADGTTQTFKGVKTVRTRDTSGVFNNRFPDVSEDTIAPEKVLEGESFHGADGKLQSGIIPTYDNVFEGGVILPSGSATLATKTATVNGTYDALNDGADGYSTFIVAVPEKEPDVGSIEITENGTYKASDEGYDGYDEITVNVPTKADPTLKEKSITANGEYLATDDNADGYSKVVVDVPEKEPTLQEKTATANGDVVADSGYDGLSKVTVNVPATKPNIAELSITENGTYTATDVDGYSPITVDVHDIIEVDELPETGEEGKLYQVREFGAIAAKHEDEIVADYGESFGSGYYTVDTKPTENIKESTAVITYFYYIKDENDIYIYDANDGWETLGTATSWGEAIPFRGEISDISEMTEDGYYAFMKTKDAYYKYSGECEDMIMYSDGETFSVIHDLYEASGNEVHLITVSSRPSTPIESADDVAYVYYIKDEKKFEYYEDGNWKSAQLTEEVVEITDISEATEENVTYALIVNWKEYHTTNGTLTITENGTYDVKNYNTVEVKDVNIIDVEEFPVNPNKIVDKFYRKDGKIYKWNADKVLSNDGDILGTWYFNETVELPSETGGYLIQFYSSGLSATNEYWRIQIDSNGVYYWDRYIEAMNTVYQNGAWLKEEWRTITIYGGSSIDNETFIAWIKANAIRKGAWEEYVVPNGSLSIELTSPLTTEFDVANYEKVSATAKAQDKTITITENGSTVVARDNGYAGMDNVYITTNVPIPDGYIKPSGSVTITANGTTDVTEKETVVVNVQPKTQTKSTTITSNGTTTISKDSAYDGMTSVSITTNVQPNLQQISQTYTENGQYELAPSTSYDGIVSAQVTVNVPTAPTPTEISTESEMTSALDTAEIGTLYKYTGTSGTYEQNAIYIVEEV